MWTPRRVLLLVLGAIGFVTAYAGYTVCLGALDGLPPLPEAYLERLKPGDFPALPEVIEKPVDIKLRQAFGPDCTEVGYTIKLDIQSKGLVLAADKYEIVDSKINPRTDPARDGQVMLVPFSLAIYGKGVGPEGTPDISTVHCDCAYLTFEQPIRQPSDMGKLRIVAAELTSLPDFPSHDRRAGKIILTNNRKTLPDNDDFGLMTRGPLMFQETGRADATGPTKPEIWTRADVIMEDRQSRPRPTTVTAVGMDIYLQKDDKNGGKSVSGSVSGVRQVDLLARVKMDLQVDSRGFLATTPATASKQPPRSEDKARVEITTNGPFHYNVVKDQARFEAASADRANPHLPNQVLLHRFGKDGVNDQLICETLDIQFRRKSSTTDKSRPASGGGMNLEIEEAHATGANVALSSDSEELAAFGNDLIYNAVKQETILKGQPHMTAMKDGSVIKAPVLILSQIQSKETNEARALGAGSITMPDRQTGKPTMEAVWSEELTFRKEMFRGRSLDTIMLVGKAEFRDTSNGQVLGGDRLKVWLEPSKGATPSGEASKTPTKPATGASQRPYRIESTGHVVSRSPQMRVRNTEHLVVWFRDGEVASGNPPPATGTTIPTVEPPRSTAGPLVPAAPGPAPAPTTPARQPAAAPAPKDQRVVDVSARSVEAFVVRLGDKHDLDRVVCEGKVKVHQDPGPKETRGVDITGETLALSHHPNGNVLDVTGPVREPGEVHLEKLSLIGPDIHIDQRDNTATIRGAGSMRMLSATDFEGKPKAKATPMTVHWKEDMFFNGNLAVFQGGVQAEQEAARLACQTMQVFLDRTVSLSQEANTTGQSKDGQAAKVDRVICHTDGQAGAGPVVVIDEQRQNGKLQKYSRIISPELALDNAEGVVEAPGPGTVSVLQEGDGSDPVKPRTDGPTTTERILKLTRVQYQGKMFTNNRTRTAKFYDNVRVTHVPTDNPELEVNLDKLPVGAMHLKCALLEVYTRTEGGRSTQEMEARGRAFVQTPEFYGQADVIKYVEAKDLVIFEGSESNPATLYRLKLNREPPDMIRGKKILYNRKTNTHQIEGGTGATIQQR